MTINNSALNYLAGLPEQNRIELESQNSFTDHFAPVQNISGNHDHMQQPSWNNNNWGYDTLAKPFAGGQMFLENSYSFLQTRAVVPRPAGRAAVLQGALRLEPVEPRHRTAPADFAGADLRQQRRQPGAQHRLPGHHLRAHHLAGARAATSGTPTSSPAPSFNKAYQQPSELPDLLPVRLHAVRGHPRKPGRGTRRGAGLRRRQHQPSPATRFTHLGEVGLGIGQDNNAVASGDRTGRVRHHRGPQHLHRRLRRGDRGRRHADQRAPPVRRGDDRPEHHCDQQPGQRGRRGLQGHGRDPVDLRHPRRTSTTTRSTNLPYDGIDIGWGWGMNDAGGSQDYANRGTYNYQPRYTTPTTLKNTDVELQQDPRHQEDLPRRRQPLQPVRQPQLHLQRQLHLRQPAHRRPVPRRGLPLRHPDQQRPAGQRRVGVHQRQRRTTTPTTMRSITTGTTAAPPKSPPAPRTTTP